MNRDLLDPLLPILQITDGLLLVSTMFLDRAVELRSEALLRFTDLSLACPPPEPEPDEHDNDEDDNCNDGCHVCLSLLDAGFG
jgi:hypothetical protein